MKIFKAWQRFGSDQLWMNRKILSELVELPQEAFQVSQSKFIFQLENGDFKSVICPAEISDPEFFWQTQASPKDLLLHTFDFETASLGGFFIGLCGHIQTERPQAGEPDLQQFGVCDFKINIQDLKKIFQSWELQQIEEWVPREVSSQRNLVEAKVLFLDRDNVIVRDVPYNKDPEKVLLIDGIVELLAKAREQGYLSAMVSNQSGVGRGIMTPAGFWSVQREVQKQLLSCKVSLDIQNWAFYHESTEVDELLMLAMHRKPRGGMFWQCQNQFLFHAQSLMIGDKASDLCAAYWGGVGQLFLIEGSSESSQGERKALQEFQKLFPDFRFQLIASLEEVQATL